MRPDARAAFERMRDAAASDEARYAKEKEQILAQAKALEKDRDVGRAKDPYFDFGEVLLQLAIVTASIAILSGSSPVYLFSIAMAVFGAVLSINGFLQLFTLPFLGPDRHGSAYSPYSSLAQSGQMPWLKSASV